MPKPYAHWDPARNAALHVRRAAGPLVLDAAEALNAALFGALAGHPCAQPMLDDPAVGYLEALRAAVATGLTAEQFESMPLGLSFYGADAVNGEPRPWDLCDATPPPWSLQVPYATLGYRIALRGYVGTVPDGSLAADVQVTWEDAEGGRTGGAPRGAYTGALLRAVAMEPALTPAMHYAYGVLHGKRPTTDANWAYHPGKIAPGGAAAGATTLANGTDDGLLRLILHGGPPTWTAQAQYWDGAAWATLYLTTDDLRSEQTPGNEAYLGIVADLVAGSASVQGGAPPGGPPGIATVFARISTAQFEPWVIDRASWGAREWSDHWAWLVAPPTPYYRPRRRPVMDLQHVPLGVPGAPAALRASDADLGVCVAFGRETWLFAAPPWDLTGALYGTGGLVHAAVCDEGAYGYQAPFAMVGRFRLQGMATWALPRYLLGAGAPWSATPGSANGMGVQWEPTGPAGAGKLVARAYNATTAAWVTAEHPFHAADYDDRPVDVGFAWSGARGSTIGRADYELRLVVDGLTVAARVDPQIRLIGSGGLTVGTPRGLASPLTLQSFEGLFREGLAFADAVTDADLRAAFGSVGPLRNASFEVAAASGRAGEADGWLWHSVQQVGGWARFNAYRATLERWWAARETFAAGYRYPYTWAYADEAARLAATGFASSDVGRSAWQRDDDSYWRLTAHAPPAWAAVTLATHDAWAPTLAAVSPLGAAGFNAGSAYLSTTEAFALWTFDAYTGPPWAAPPTLVAPADDATGFDSWYDALFGTAAYPLRVDAFGEAWGTDPLSTAPGPHWVSGRCPDGAVRGAPLAFPLTLRPDHARLLVYADYGRVYALSLTPGTYSSAASLAAMLQATWVAAGGGTTGVAFTAYVVGTATGITFGWDGTPTTIQLILGVLEREPHRDARAPLGLAGLGPLGGASRVRVPMELVPTNPAGVRAGDAYLLDGWSALHFRTTTDPYTTDLLPVPYNWIAALFDGAATLREALTIAGWYGPGASWQGSYTPGDLYAAVFNGMDVEEDFTPANWPDEGY